MTTEDSTKKNEAREGEMVGAESPFSQTQKRRVVTHKRISGNCADCRKFLPGHWIKVYPDGKKEEYPYGYCRDPRGERGLCMVFRPKEETLFEMTRVNMTFTHGYPSSEQKLERLFKCNLKFLKENYYSVKLSEHERAVSVPCLTGEGGQRGFLPGPVI